jgi:hypothetical protein
MQSHAARRAKARIVKGAVLKFGLEVAGSLKRENGRFGEGIQAADVT